MHFSLIHLSIAAAIAGVADDPKITGATAGHAQLSIDDADAQERSMIGNRKEGIGRRELSSVELERLLSGHAMTRADKSTGERAFEERFHADGSWEIFLGGRAVTRQAGKWNVGNGHICVESGAKQLCRVMIEDQGSLFIEPFWQRATPLIAVLIKKIGN